MFSTRALGVFGAAMAIAGGAHATTIRFDTSSNFTGTTTGGYVPVGGGDLTQIATGTNDPPQFYTADTAGGGTSGGLVGGPAHSFARFNGSITAALTGNTQTLTYNYSGAASFDITGYSGQISSAFIGNIVFEVVGGTTPFSMSVTGFQGDTVSLLALSSGASTADGMLTPGFYGLRHNGGVFASSASGIASETVTGTVVLTIPAPGMLGIAGALGVLAMRRRRW